MPTTTRLIVIIHGIHTSKERAASWMPALGRHLKGDDTACAVNVYTYGWRSGTAMRFPIVGWFSRRARVKRFQRHIAKLRLLYPGAKIQVVAHSYGTWISHYAMAKGKLEMRTWYDDIVYMGSIVHQDEYGKSVPVGRAINLYSPDDKVVDGAPGFGESGTVGFVPAGNGRIENKHMSGYRHGHYLEPGLAWDTARDFLVS